MWKKRIQISSKSKKLIKNINEISTTINDIDKDKGCDLFKKKSLNQLLKKQLYNFNKLNKSINVNNKDQLNVNNKFIGLMQKVNKLLDVEILQLEQTSDEETDDDDNNNTNF